MKDSKIPSRIEVVRGGSVAQILVDGEPFPFAVSRESIRVDVHPDEVPTVTLTLMAERVDVRNSLDAGG